MRRARRRQQEQDEREVFQLREQMFDIGDDYWIETSRGRRAFKVNGKVLRARDTLVIEAPDGSALVTMKHRPVRVRETWTIDRAGRPEATVRKAMVTPLRERWTVAADDIGEWKVHGNIVDHEYEIEDDDGDTVAEVSKRWFRVRDTYGIEVVQTDDVPLVIAVTVAVDRAAHD